MKIWLRDLTVDRDFELNLPHTEIDSVLNPNHEYIVIDGLIPELTHIQSFNEWLLETEISEDDLRILLEVRLLSEIMNEDFDYTIIDFDAETSSWGYGNGVISSEENFGLLLYEEGWNYLPFEPTEEMEDYIKWEANWNAATTGDKWHNVCVNGNYYLIRA